jgi:hypothetical protein
MHGTCAGIARLTVDKVVCTTAVLLFNRSDCLDAALEFTNDVCEYQGHTPRGFHPASLSAFTAQKYAAQPDFIFKASIP